MKSHELRFRIAASLIAALVLLAIGLLFWQLRTWQEEERALARRQLIEAGSQLAPTNMAHTKALIGRFLQGN